jgi:GntP family gluconate:H+ symporter
MCFAYPPRYSGKTIVAARRVLRNTDIDYSGMFSSKPSTGRLHHWTSREGLGTMMFQALPALHSPAVTLLAEGDSAATATAVGSEPRLLAATIIGFAVIIALITWLKVSPFLALTVGALGVGIGAGMAPADALTSFTKGFGDTAGGVGVLIALGAMFGKMLADSGGADRIVDTLVDRSSPRFLPWTMAVVGAVIGLPMFFEIGLVLLIPIIILVTRRSGLPLMKIAIPTLSGLSTMHGLVPPHPGPLIAIDALKANLGLTLALGILVAIPTLIIAGPLFSGFAARWAPVPVPPLFGVPDQYRTGPGNDPQEQERVSRKFKHGEQAGAQTPAGATADEDAPFTPTRRPPFGNALASILLPVVLMLLKAIVEVFAPASSGFLWHLIDFLGTPAVALLITVFVSIFTLGLPSGMGRAQVAKTLESSVPPIAGIILIVGAGGAFKQILVDTGIGTVITAGVLGTGVSIVLLGWLVSALVRVATGSATVATVTAAGLMAPAAAELPTAEVSLLVLAVGAGSVFLSHVNDAGFWLVKQYLGTSVTQTFKTWTVLESLISVVGLLGALLLDVFI